MRGLFYGLISGLALIVSVGAAGSAETDIYPCGDVTGDGALNVMDVVASVGVILGQSEPSTLMCGGADATQDACPSEAGCESDAECGVGMGCAQGQCQLDVKGEDLPCVLDQSCSMADVCEGGVCVITQGLLELAMSGAEQVLCEQSGLAYEDGKCVPIAGQCLGQVDECGVCGGGGIADGTCDCDGNAVDCAGECGGGAMMDECGECGGGGIAAGACDCAGNVDLGCGCGEAGPSGCDNACGSTLTLDECGVCGGSGISECACDCAGNVVDCAGECGGAATCADITTDNPACDWDTEVWSGIGDGVCVCAVDSAVRDCSGVCGGDDSSCEGCDGVQNSGAVLDECGECGGPGLNSEGCCVNFWQYVTNSTCIESSCCESLGGAISNTSWCYMEHFTFSWCLSDYWTCGDGYCDAGESCVACPLDCGVCAGSGN